MEKLMEIENDDDEVKIDDDEVIKLMMTERNTQ